MMGVWFLLIFITTHYHAAAQLAVEISATVNGATVRPRDGLVVIKLGDEVTLTCEVNVNSQTSVEWTGLLGTVSKDKEYTVKKVTMMDLQNFTCTGSSNDGRRVKGRVKLAIKAAPTCTSLLPAKGEITTDGNGNINAQFDCQVTGYPEPEVTWVKVKNRGDGSEIGIFIQETDNYKFEVGPPPINGVITASQVKRHSLLIKNVKSSNYGIYYCNARNTLGSCPFQSQFAEFELKRRECKVTPNGKNYQGSINVTASGKQCQRWDANVPHKIPLQFQEAAKDQENYCRNLDNSNDPFCFTTDPNIEWEYCSVPKCAPPAAEIRVIVDGKEVKPVQGITTLYPSIPPGANVSLICDASGQPKPDTRWYSGVVFKNNGYYVSMMNLPDGQKWFMGSQYTTSKITSNQLFRCVIDNKVYPPERLPAINLSVEKKPTCEIRNGAEITLDPKTTVRTMMLSCSIQADPPPAVTWFRNGAKLTPDDKYNISTMPELDITFPLSTLTVKNVGLSDIGVYTCFSENKVGKCSLKADTANVNVTDSILSPNCFVVTKEPRREVNGNNVNLRIDCGISALSEQNLNIQWFYKEKEDSLKGIMINTTDTSKYLQNIGIFPFGTTTVRVASLTIRNVQVKDYGVYYCYAKNAFGECPRYEPDLGFTINQKSFEG